MTIGLMGSGLLLMWAADWKYRIGWLWWCGFAGFMLGLVSTLFLACGYAYLNIRDRRRSAAVSSVAARRNPIG